MTTVSVIIPTYNRASMVKDAIESVLVQTHTDHEIIVVDDGSTDNTREIVASFSNKVRYVYQQNRGRSNARNHGLRLAQGKYIAFLDDDDMFLPTKLEKQVARLETEPNFGMVYSSAICTDERRNEISRRYHANESGDIYRKIAFYLPVTILLPTVLVRNEVMANVGGFDENMNRFEDTDMWRRIAKRYRILAMPETLTVTRTHAGNTLTNQDSQKIREALDYYVTKVFREDHDKGFVFRRRGAARLYAHYGQAFLANRELHNQSRQLLARSIKYWPFQKNAYALLALAYPDCWPLAFAVSLWRKTRKVIFRHPGHGERQAEINGGTARE
ncbi:MAG: glycosyltransferase family 2 protein [Chloroflexi bacterium]|nr:glycosyltransferase family 2 protein [Chloroflexota bacterium]